MDSQKNPTHNTRHEKQTIKIKLIKTGKKSGTTNWLGCKDYTDNFKPQEVKMTLEKNQTVLFVVN